MTRLDSILEISPATIKTPFALPSMNSPATKKLNAIPIPAQRRMTLAINSWLPVMFFAVSCGICLCLWQFQSGAVTLIGEVEVVEYTINSLEDGFVSEIVPGYPASRVAFANVAKDQLVAVLNDRMLSERLDDAILTLKAIGNEIEQSSKIGSPTVDIPPSTFAQLERLVKLLGNESETLRLKLQMRRLAVDATEQRQELAFAIEKNLAELGFAATDNASPSSSGTAPSLSARIFRQRCESIRSELGAITSSLTRLDSRSPIAGRITKAHVRPGDAVTKGQALVTVVPTQGHHVVAYARENINMAPYAGMPVTLRSHAAPMKQIETIVESVGPAIESIPSRQRGLARIEEWGRPVRIKLPAAMELAPGALVEIMVDASADQ